MASGSLVFDILARDRASSEFKNVGSSADRLRSKLSSVGKVAATAFAGATAALGAAGGAAALFGVKAAASFQQTTISFEGILGSAQQAKVMLDSLRVFAARTPFQFPELATSAKQLLAVGFNARDVLPIMTKLGNVAATLGVGGPEIDGVVRALGQMKGKGKASAEELNQISEQIPGFSAVKAIAEGMGISVAEAFKKMAIGAIPADQAISAILTGMEKFPGAAGAMDRQSQTLNGVISTLKDTVTGLAIDFITPYLPGMSAAVSTLTTWMQNTLPGAFAAVGGAMDGLMSKIAPFVSGVMGALSGLVNGDTAGAGQKLGVALGLDPAAVTSAMDGVKQALSTGLDSAKQIVSDVLAGIAQFWEDHRAKIMVILQQYVGVIQSGFVAIQAVVGTVLAVVTDLWDRFGSTLLDKLRIAFDAVIEIIRGALEVMKGIFDLITAVLTGKWGDAWDAIKAILDGVWDTIVGVLKLGLDALSLAFEAFKAVFSAAWSLLWNAVKTVFSDIWDGIRGKLGEVWDSITSTVSTKMGELVGFFQGLPGRLIGALGDIASKMQGIGRDIVQGIIDGIEGAAGRIGSAVKNAIPGAGIIGGAISRIPGFASGVSNFSGGLALVGERGPEIVNLPRGSDVIPNGASLGSPDPDEWGRRAARAYAQELRLQMRTA